MHRTPRFVRSLAQPSSTPPELSGSLQSPPTAPHMRYTMRYPAFPPSPVSPRNAITHMTAPNPAADRPLVRPGPFSCVPELSGTHLEHTQNTPGTITTTIVCTRRAEGCRNGQIFSVLSCSPPPHTSCAKHSEQYLDVCIKQWRYPQSSLHLFLFPQVPRHPHDNRNTLPSPSNRPFTPCTAPLTPLTPLTPVTSLTPSFFRAHE